MTVLVAKKELANYKETIGNFEIITHNNLKSLSEIRQFAYDKFGDVFFVDDDIVSVERVYETKNSKLTPIEIFNLIQKTYLQAKDLNAFLFGFNSDPSPTHYNQHKPFMLNGYINGCALGILKNKNLFFSKKTIACESHWLALLNAYHNRFCFIDKRYHFRQKTNSTFNLVGGQSGLRTLETEKQDTIFLKKMFGNSVMLKKEKNKTKRIHEYQRVLNIKL